MPGPRANGWASGDRGSDSRPAISAAAVVTNLGGQGALIASAFAVLEAGGDGGDVGLVAAARTLPLVLFLLIGGAVADRLPRHRVMVAANALNCVSQAVFAVLVLAGEARLWQMMLLSALGGTGQAFFSPAAVGMLMSSVRGAGEPHLRHVPMAMQGVGLGGAALGGAMVAVVGPGWVLAVDAVTFAVAGALRSFLDVSRIPPREPGGGPLSDLREGWREFVGRLWLWLWLWLWTIVAQFSVVVAVVGGADAVYGPLVARDSLGGPGPWGLALGAFGAGTVGGALLMTRWKPRRLLLAGTLCVFPLATPAAALAVPVPVGPLCAVMFVSGAAIEVFGVLWMTPCWTRDHCESTHVEPMGPVGTARGSQPGSWCAVASSCSVAQDQPTGPSSACLWERPRRSRGFRCPRVLSRSRCRAPYGSRLSAARPGRARSSGS
ncbi:MFS transporter [Streptomyces mirabilis]|uniref:MFS transporter n=1 Tax=Streptomyces mirabilis TaxID=68239 RepID=UPI003687DE6F